MTSETKSNSCATNIYIKHESDLKLWKIPYAGGLHSNLIKDIICNNSNGLYAIGEKTPIIIKSVKLDTIQLIVNYMEFYNDKPEIPAPNFPLNYIHISIILKDEYHLFTDIYIESDSVKTNILRLNDFINTAIYFNMPTLQNKLCAIVAYIIMNIPTADLKDIII